MFKYGKKAGYMGIALLVLAVLPLVVAACVLPNIGPEVATKFNAAGEATRWGKSYELLALPVGDVLGGRHRQAHAAVEARQQPGLGQQLHVAAHRLQRHAEALGQRLDRHHAAGADLVEQFGLAGVRSHARDCRGAVPGRG